MDGASLHAENSNPTSLEPEHMRVLCELICPAPFLPTDKYREKPAFVHPNI